MRSRSKRAKVTGRLEPSYSLLPRSSSVKAASSLGMFGSFPFSHDCIVTCITLFRTCSCMSSGGPLNSLSSLYPLSHLRALTVSPTSSMSLLFRHSRCWLRRLRRPSWITFGGEGRGKISRACWDFSSLAARSCTKTLTSQRAIWLARRSRAHVSGAGGVSPRPPPFLPFLLGATADGREPSATAFAAAPHRPPSPSFLHGSLFEPGAATQSLPFLSLDAHCFNCGITTSSGPR